MSSESYNQYQNYLYKLDYIHPKLDGQRKHKKYLELFWSYFGSDKNTGEEYDAIYKLQKLLDFSTVIITFKSAPKQTNTKLKREQFDKTKQYIHKMQTHKICFICCDVATIRHHIIALKNGGLNTKRNLVSLCESCHNRIHDWLGSSESV